MYSRQSMSCIARFFIRCFTVALLLYTFSQAAASSRQDSLSVDIQGKNMTIAQIFKALHQQTGYIVFYNNGIIDDQERLDMNFVHADLRKVLDFLTKGRQLSYVIKNRFILLQKAAASISPMGQSGLQTAVAPDTTITGNVHDDQGQPLPGVSVVLKGTTTGTVTDVQGNYSIESPNTQGTLVFSYVGFATQEVPINHHTALDVTLGSSVSALTQVVVTALGIKRSVESLNYAVQDVSGDKLNKAKETNFINTLQGKVAGVTITKNATGPGSDSKVLIRGNRSLMGNSQPLFVIDGVPLAGNVGMLNSDNIESVTVLKGASAAALYGSQGQNGAIIITTKKGKAGEISVNYSGGLTMNQALVLPELQYEYGQGDAGVYSANSEHGWGPKAEGQMVKLWNGDEVPLKGQPDRLKNFFRTAKTLTNTLSVTGGTDKVQVYFSYGNTLAQGIMRNNDLTRHNVDLKINSYISPKLSLLTKLTYIYEDVNNRVRPGDGGTYALPSIFCAPTSIPLGEMQKYSYIDNTGTERQSYWLPGSSVLLNPYWALNRVLYYQQSDRIIGLFTAKYDFTDWLNIQVRGSIDKTIQNDDHKVYADSYFSQVGSDYDYGDSRHQSVNLDALLSFNRDLTRNINLTGNIGVAVQQGNYKDVSGSANGLFKPNFFFMSNAKSPYVTNSNGRNPQVQSLYGTATFAYKRYLYLDVTARNDWSSALPKENQSYFYPSIGLSGIVSEMLHLPSWVSYGKFRISLANAGYGGQEYLDRNYYSVGSGGAVITPSIQSIGTYKPEITNSFEVGLDWQFFDSRLGFNFTYYNTKTKNQLLLIGPPPGTLFQQKYINAGLIQNKGIEVVMNATPVRSENFSWDIGVNFSKNRNKIVRLTPTISSIVISDGDNVYLIKADKGGSYGDMYVKGWAKDSLGRHLVGSDGMPILTDGLDQFIGNYNPDFMLGVSNSFRYKNFTLSFLIDHRQGGTVIAGTQALIDQYGHSKASLQGREGGIVLDGYTRDGKKNTQSVSPQKYFGLIGGRYPAAGFYSYSSTNTRLRELTVGYSLPQSMLSRIKFIKQAEISVVGRNLFFIQRDAPIDPEVTRGVDGGGLEYCALPSTRDLGINLRLSF